MRFFSGVLFSLAIAIVAANHLPLTPRCNIPYSFSLSLSSVPLFRSAEIMDEAKVSPPLHFSLS
jgi:hypothetical protein